MGAPGAGKSTYAAKFSNVVTNDQNGTPGEILHQSYKRVNENLAAGKDVVFDATASNPRVRKAILGIAKRHGAETAVHVLDTSAQACVDAQKGRTRPVAESDVRRIHADVQRQAPGLKKEGFGQVNVIRR